MDAPLNNMIKTYYCNVKTLGAKIETQDYTNLIHIKLNDWHKPTARNRPIF